MKLKIPLKRAIQSAILLLMLIAIVVVWPLGLFRPWQYCGEIDKKSTSVIMNEGTVLQEFIPVKPGLSNVSFYIYNEEELEDKKGLLVFRIFDEGLKKLDEKDFILNNIKLPGLFTVKFRDELIPGTKYYFSIENPGNSLLFAMADGTNLDARYGYHTYFTKSQYALYALVVFGIGGLLIALCEILLKKDKHQVKSDLGLRLALSILTVICSGWAAYNVFPSMKFTRNVLDIVFFEVGILVFAILGLYGLLYKRELPSKEILPVCEMKKKIPGLLQTLAFAGIMAGCVNYVNALYTYQQQLATNIVLCCFALAIILGYSKKEILNWYNLVYIFPAIGAGIYYVLNHSNGLEDATIAKGTVTYFILWGVVALNTIRLLIDHKWKKINLLYTIGFVILIAELIRSRNTRIWPIYIAVFFGLFAIRVIAKGNTVDYMDRFTCGVMIHFVYISFYTFLYRPFHYFQFIRYPVVFHTVTVTAVYLLFVLMLSVARFLAVYREKRRLKYALKELWLMGMAEAFLIMTVSRTGLLCVVILAPLTFLITAFTQYRDGIKGALKRMLLFCINGIVFFFIIFTTCRIVPAVVGNPYIYDTEHFVDSVKSGEEWDSYRYATVSRFFGFADAKLTYYNSNTELTHEAQSLGATFDYSNGRLDIYKAYLKALDWKGHDTLSLTDENGILIIHAHNSYIQAAYDFGIGAGIYFLLFCIGTGVMGIMYYVKHKEERTSLIPVMVIASFGACGIVERVFFPFIPLGFAFLFIIVLLTVADKKGKNEENN